MRRLRAGLLLVLTTLAARGAAPPASPRNLTAQEQKEVDALQDRLDPLAAAGEFAQAARLAEQIAMFRTQRQGGRHWEAIDARFAVAVWQRLAKVAEGDRAAVVQANALGHKGLTLLVQRRFREAEKLLDQALVIRRKVLGEQHPDTARIYSSVAFCLDSQGKRSDALPLLRRALDINVKALGEQHPDTASSYNDAAMCLESQGKQDEALPLLRHALSIRLQVLGEQHPDTALSYHNLAFCLSRQGRDSEAVPLYRHALAVHLKVRHEKHPYTGLTCKGLARCLDRLGRYSEAQPLHQRALAISLEVQGMQSPVTATDYHNLAACLDSQGKHAEALPLHQRALEIRLKVLGEQHPDTAYSYNGMAYCLNGQGKFAEALPLYQRTLVIRRKLLGEEHADTAISYNNVAACFSNQGKRAEALPLFRQALATCRKVLGEQHPHTILSYNNVASCLDSEGNHVEALPLLRHTLTISIKVHGEEHPQTFLGYINLAGCLNSQGKHAEALPLYQRALAISLKVFGEEHPYTVRGYQNLASCLAWQGKHGEALPLYQRALVISRKILGEQHPQTASICNQLAICLSNQGRRAEALHLLQASLPDQEAARFQTASTGFERAFASASNASPHAMLAVGLAHLGQPRNALHHAELALARGLLDDLAGSDPDERARIAALAADLHKLGERLVALLGLPALSAEQAAQRDQLIRRRRLLQADLSRLASAVSARQVLPLERIQRQIPAHAALVLWIDDLGEHFACVLGPQGPARWVPLRGSGKGGLWTKDDDNLIERCYASLTDPTTGTTLREALFRQRLAPLEGHLKGVKHLLVVPAGALTKMPVEALTDSWTISYVPSGSAFARAVEMQSKPRSTSALVLADPVFTATPPKYPPVPPHGLLVKAIINGGIAARIGLRPGDVLQEYAGKLLKASGELKTTAGDERVAIKLWRDGNTMAGRIPAGTLGVVIDKRPVGEALAAWRNEERKLLAYNRGQDWTPLPGTRLEAQMLASLLPSATVLLGSAASEQSLEEMATAGKLKGIRLLHLATHGEANATRPLNTALILSQDRLPQPKEQEARVLAGKKPVEGKLSVDTILKHWQLDADLVTLSACQTGLGADAKGEGMLGFAQALLQKGAKSVLLSRWKVDDNATALLMVRFYENLLGKRDGLKAPLPKAEALREAKAWLRTLSREEAQKRLTVLVDGVPRGERGSVRKALPARKPEAGKEDRPFAHPYYWAAFVLIGDPR